MKPTKTPRYEQEAVAGKTNNQEQSEENKLGILVKVSKERGDSDVTEPGRPSAMEVMTPSKMSQKQCLRMLNTRLANNIERIGPLVAENQELTHMNDLLRVQLLQEKEDRKRQIDALKARLEKALQEKVIPAVLVIHIGVTMTWCSPLHVLIS